MYEHLFCFFNALYVYYLVFVFNVGKDIKLTVVILMSFIFYKLIRFLLSK